MRYVYDTFTLGTLLRWGFGIAVVIGLIWYGHFQARAFLTGPVLTLSEDLSLAHTDQVVLIEGTAENVTEISLNDRPISTDEAGNFSEELVLENGYTIMTLRAEDRYGRHTTVTRPFVYTPAYGY